MKRTTRNVLSCRKGKWLVIKFAACDRLCQNGNNPLLLLFVTFDLSMTPTNVKSHKCCDP